MKDAAGRAGQEARPPEENEAQGFWKNGWWRPALLLGLLLSAAVGLWFLGAGEKFWALRQWITSLGPWGVVVFVLIYIIAVVAVVPGDLITMTAGAIFGSVLGVVVVSIGATAGASLAFLISRYFARDAVVRWLGKNKKFQELDRLTAEHGAIIVALTRLIFFFPFNLLNYGFGLTKVPFWTFVFWSWLCMIPGTIFFVVGADALAQALMQGQVVWSLIGIGAIALLLLLVLARYAKRTLLRKGTSAGSGQSGNPCRRRRRTGKRGQGRSGSRNIPAGASSHRRRPR